MGFGHYTASIPNNQRLCRSGHPGLGSQQSGSSQTFTISAAANYHIADVRVDGNSVGAVSSYTFSLVNTDHSIFASFAPDAFVIEANAGLGGSISPSFAAPDVGPQGTVLIFELTVTDAGGLQDTNNCAVVVTWDNMEPLADAGPDMQVAIGDSAVLDGSDSFDPDGQELAYQWRQTFGPPVAISDATSVRPKFEITMKDDLEGLVLTFELTVTDIGGLQGVDTCQITILAAVQSEDTMPPTLNIENPSTQWVITVNKRIVITGSAIDDHEVEKIIWQDSRGSSGVVKGTAQRRIEHPGLHFGLNKISITAFDSAGNKQSKSINVYLLSWWFR